MMSENSTGKGTGSSGAPKSPMSDSLARNGGNVAKDQEQSGSNADEEKLLRGIIITITNTRASASFKKGLSCQTCR
jgi:hypothetical protein